MRPLIAASILCAASLATPAAVKESPPQSPPPKPFHLPPTDDLTLPNGMKVTIVPYGVVPKVAIRAFVSAGAVNESAGQVWLSRLNASMMKEGTPARSAEQVAREAADMGGQLEINAGSEFTSVGGVVLSDFGTKFIALLADVLQHPSLPASEIARLKADLGRELAVEKTERKLDPGLRRAIQDAFRDWPKGSEPADLPANPVKARSLHVVDRPGAAQSTLYMGLPVPGPTSSDYIVLDVLNSLLGGSFTSRITTNIREQKGYTYSPFSQIGTRHHLAFWLQVADVTTNVTGPSLKEIYAEIDRIRKEPPPEGELKGIQNYLAGLFILKNTISPDAVIGQLHFVDSQGMDRSFLSTYTQKVMAVTPQQIQGAAESYLVPSKMTVVVVGDKAKIAD